MPSFYRLIPLILALEPRTIRLLHGRYEPQMIWALFHRAPTFSLVSFRPYSIESGLNCSNKLKQIDPHRPSLSKIYSEMVGRSAWYRTCKSSFYPDAFGRPSALGWLKKIYV